MAVEVVRRGGKFEAIGFLLILLGMAGCFSSAAVGVAGAFIGTPLFVAGCVVFLIGRFM